MERKNMQDLKEELKENVLSSFLIFVGAIISIYYGNLTKGMFDRFNISVEMYIFTCYVVPFIFMLLELWLVLKVRRIVKEINKLQ